MTYKPYMALKCPNCGGTCTTSESDFDCPSCFGMGVLIIDRYSGQYVYQELPPDMAKEVEKIKGAKNV